MIKMYLTPGPIEDAELHFRHPDGQWELEKGADLELNHGIRLSPEWSQKSLDGFLAYREWEMSNPLPTPIPYVPTWEMQPKLKIFVPTDWDKIAEKQGWIYIGEIES